MSLRLDRDWLRDLRLRAQDAEKRRPRADYKTGTISEAAALYLRGLTEWLRPQVIVEVGTFIGTSTFAMLAPRVYTCDKDNACVRDTEFVKCYPKTRSTRMFEDLIANHIRAGFFFFDGRIQWEDLPLIEQLSTPQTVYAFDDYERHEKGVINVGLLLPRLKGYRFVPPPKAILDLDTTTTIAVLVPEASTL